MELGPLISTPDTPGALGDVGSREAGSPHASAVSATMPMTRDNLCMVPPCELLAEAEARAEKEQRAPDLDLLFELRERLVLHRDSRIAVPDATPDANHLREEVCEVAAEVKTETTAFDILCREPGDRDAVRQRHDTGRLGIGHGVDHF